MSQMYTTAAGKPVFKDASVSTRRGPRPGGPRPPGSIKPVYGAQHPPLHQPPDPNVLKSITETPKKKILAPQHKTNHPPVDGPRGVRQAAGGAHGDSFEDFASRTSDAWDDGDDDLLAIATSNLNVETTVNSHAFPQKVIRKSRGSSGPVVESDSVQRTPSNRRATVGRSSTNDSTASTASTSTTVAATWKSPAPGMALRLGPTGQPLPIMGKSSSIGILASMNVPDRPTARLSKFHDLLSSPNTNLDELRELSWNGIPKAVRPVAWQLLSGYLPANVERRQATLERKRLEYFGFVDQYFPQRNSTMHQDTYRQIHIDIPRMNPLIPLFQHQVVQDIFERILFIWAVRHPASGYVQGMNDLVTPFFVVFLTQFLEHVNYDNIDVTSSTSLNSKDLSLNGISESKLKTVEADSFWCFNKLLDGIQDNYTFAQPGIQLKVIKLKDLTKRVDVDLHTHMEQEQVEYLQFAFRWMNNLLMREMPLHCTIRLWDTYWSEPDGFAIFHLYVCAAFLNLWSKDLKQRKDFQGMMIFLQNPPTSLWGDAEISLMLAEAFRLKFLFAEAPNHLRETTDPPPLLLPH